MENTDSIISMFDYIQNKINKLIIKELKENGLEGLAPSHGSILVLLYDKKKAIPMNQITQTINKEKSTVTALINKLEKMELIEKFKHETDSRSTLIKITKKGQETKPIFDRISRNLIDQTYIGISETEKYLITDVLKKIKANFE